MALAVQMELQERKIVVDKAKLIEHLKLNKEKHLKEYYEAAAAYKTSAIQMLEDERKKISRQLTKRYSEIIDGINKFDSLNPTATLDSWNIISTTNIHLKVPRNFSHIYDKAISVAEWDVNETLTISYAEFQCFIHDEWDWKAEFTAVSSLYKMK